MSSQETGPPEHPQRPRLPWSGAPGTRKGRALAGILLLLLIATLGVWSFHLLNKRPVVRVVPFPMSTGQAGPSVRFERNLVLGIAQASELQLTPDGKKVPPLNEIRGLGVSWDGTRVYAADPGNGIVNVFGRAGNAIKVLGQDGPGRLRGPGAVAEAPDGRIFVTDRLTNRLVIFDHDGNFLDDFRPSNLPPSFSLVPISLAFAPDGTLYAGDGNGAVYVFDVSSKLRIRLVPPEGRFEAPWGIAVNTSTLVVTDSSHQRARIFSPDGTPISTLGGESGGAALSLPRGVALDGRGYIFVSDTFAHRIQLFDSNGRYVGNFGEEGYRDGQFSYPEGVTLDGQGTVYVADRGNRRIQVWRY